MDSLDIMPEEFEVQILDPIGDPILCSYIKTKYLKNIKSLAVSDAIDLIESSYKTVIKDNFDVSISW